MQSLPYIVSTPQQPAKTYANSLLMYTSKIYIGYVHPLAKRRKKETANKSNIKGTYIGESLLIIGI